MPEVPMLVPQEHAAAMYAYLAQIMQSQPPPTQPAPARPAWTTETAGDAVAQLFDEEKALLRRVAEARGRRVPISELQTALGLPGTPSLEHDFPDLTRFCAKAANPAMPVVTGGEGDDAWYWMSPDDAFAVRAAFADPARDQV